MRLCTLTRGSRELPIACFLGMKYKTLAVAVRVGFITFTVVLVVFLYKQRRNAKRELALAH